MQLDKLNTDGLKALQSFSSQTAEIVQDYIKDIGKSTLSDKDKIISALNLIKEKEENFLKLHQSEYKSTTSDTFEHSFAVAKIMKEYAKQKGMSAEMQDVLYIAGLAHDIGKIAIDNNILLKNGRLTPEEKEKMDKHAHIGKQIIEELNLSEKVNKFCQIAADAHHLSYGNDNNILKNVLSNAGLSTNIEDALQMVYTLSVVDKMHALMSDRCYKEGLSYEVTGSILNDCYERNEFHHETFVDFMDNVVPKMGLVKALESKKQFAPAAEKYKEIIGKINKKITQDYLNNNKREALMPKEMQNNIKPVLNPNARAMQN